MSNRLAVAPNDLSAFWMPFTANRQFKKAPRMLVGAQDMHYTASDGRKILDGTAGLWCVNAGHCRPKITEAIREQAAETADRGITAVPFFLINGRWPVPGAQEPETLLRVLDKAQAAGAEAQ